MDNDKFQELVLQQLQNINSRMDSLDKSQDILASELMAVKTDVQKVKSTVTRIEHNHGEILGALQDGYKQNAEILDRHTEQLNRIEEKIESHDIQISVLNRSKSNKQIVK